MHVTVIFHCFEREPVLGESMCMLGSCSMDLNWNLCSGMACACYAHFPFITITLTDDFNK